MKKLSNFFIVMFLFSSSVIAGTYVESIETMQENGNTIVIVTTSNEKPEFDANGSFHAEQGDTDQFGSHIALFAVITSTGAYSCKVSRKTDPFVFDQVLEMARGNLAKKFGVVIAPNPDPEGDGICVQVMYVNQQYVNAFPPPQDKND